MYLCRRKDNRLKTSHSNIVTMWSNLLMRLKTDYMNKVLALVLTIVALAAGQTAMAR